MAEVGSSQSELVTATVYPADMASYDQVTAAGEAWVDAEHTPARATIEARLTSPRYLVEIALVAAV